MSEIIGLAAGVVLCLLAATVSFLSACHFILELWRRL
jgi:hypothetical protein